MFLYISIFKSIQHGLYISIPFPFRLSTTSWQSKLKTLAFSHSPAPSQSTWTSLMSTTMPQNSTPAPTATRCGRMPPWEPASWLSQQLTSMQVSVSPIIKKIIKKSHLIFSMGISIPVWWHIYIEMALIRTYLGLQTIDLINWYNIRCEIFLTYQSVFIFPWCTVEYGIFFFIPAELNAEVRYSITGGDPLGKFTVDEMTGEVRTAKLLDREEQGYYNLAITAQDQGLPESARLESVAMVGASRGGSGKKSVLTVVWDFA